MNISHLLDRMQVLDAELRTGSGQAHEARGITALNMAQDGLEAILARFPKVMQTFDTIQTTANVEYTAYPNDRTTGEQLLRIDAMWMLDDNARQIYKLGRVTIPGGQTPQAPPPLNLVLQTSANGTGRPTDYYPQGLGGQIMWSPTPDDAYSVRWYGFKTAATFDDRDDPWAYPDMLSTPVAAVACRLIRIGKDDPTEDLKALADEYLLPAVQAMKKHNRDGASGFAYTQVHLT